MESEMVDKQNKRIIKLNMGETARILAMLKEIPYNRWECKTEGDTDIPAEESCSDLPRTKYSTSTTYHTRTERFTADVSKKRGYL